MFVIIITINFNVYFMHRNDTENIYYISAKVSGQFVQLVCIHTPHWSHWTQSTVFLIALSSSSIHTPQHFGSVFIKVVLHCTICSREGFDRFGCDAVLFALVD